MDIQSLKSLQLGDVAAEADPELDRYFVNTYEFDQVLNDYADLVLGIKGSGKSAIFVILQKKASELFTQKRIVLLPSTQDEAETVEVVAEHHMTSVEPKDYELLWYYLISHAVAKKLNDSPFVNDAQVQDFLLRYPLSSTWSQPLTIERKVFYSRYLREANSLLSSCNYRIWFLMDKFDKFFEKQSDRPKRLELLASLIRVYLNLRDYPFLRIKIFLRTDLSRELSSITDKDKISRQIGLKWDQERLLELLLTRIEKLNPGISFSSDSLDGRFSDVFDTVMGQTAKKGYTSNWLFNHLKDGNEVITPRDLLWLVRFAKEEQLYLTQKQNTTSDIKISGRAIKKAFSEKFSEHKFNNYLTNEFPHLKSLFSKFKNASSLYTKDEIVKLLGSEVELNQLLETGFLKFIPASLKRSWENSDTYEVSEMYRGALEIKRRYRNS